MWTRFLIPFVLALPGAFAQTFEVSVIKPSASSDNRVGIRIEPGGRFTASGTTVRVLIGMAYDVREFQILNAPGWTAAERYDISAKAADTAGDRIPMEQLRVMLRALLEERLQLKIHKETKETAAYALVVAKGGAKLTPVDAAQGGPNQMRMGRGQISGSRMPLSALAQQLAGQLGRPVLDKTDLTGYYDIKLEWTPEPGRGPLGGPPSHDAVQPADSSGPTLFTALQEQLGLRLESTKGPAEMIVIDRVEKPSEN